VPSALLSQIVPATPNIAHRTYWSLMTAYRTYTLADFDFELPEALIAQHPAAERQQSRLLHVQGQKRTDLQFPDVLNLLEPGDVLVFNNTKVMKARLFAAKPTGGRVEILVERVHGDYRATAMLKASHAPKPGLRLEIAPGIEVQVMARDERFYELAFSHNLWQVLDEYGTLPLPPYIEREATTEDEQRYQTVYAQTPGAVAAPTAGLHFTETLLQQLQQRGIQLQFLTLHVGAGTFLPVQTDNIAEHKMHSEWYSISPETVAAIEQVKATQGRVVAVGTTSLRALEAASQSGRLQAGSGETDIFITPGFQFQTVDRLITNFHLPKSTLMMLVSAFAGYDHIMQAYQQAVQQGYRFFSYGDAMLLERQA
jgi:S-adenosylmethionine:tRNA ribosyltransferase-isomerase